MSSSLRPPPPPPPPAAAAAAAGGSPTSWLTSSSTSSSHNHNNKTTTTTIQQDQKSNIHSNRSGGSGPTSLTPLLRHLSGLTVTVELKNGNCYRGVLESADDFMNLTLCRCISSSYSSSLTSAVQHRQRQQQRQQQQREEEEEVYGGGCFGENRKKKACKFDYRHNPCAFVNKNQEKEPSELKPVNPSTQDSIKQGKTEPDALEYDLLHVRGPSIRYIHFPNHLDGSNDLNHYIQAGLNRERAAFNKYQRGKRKDR